MGATSKHPHLLDWIWKKNGALRKSLLTFMVLSFLILFFYYTQFNGRNVNKEFSSNLSKVRKKPDEDKYLIHTSKCRIPNEDPFNEEIKKFIHKDSYVPCSQKPLLTYIETNNSVFTLRINKTVLSSYSAFKLSCCFQYIERKKNDRDDGLNISECVNFEDQVEVKKSIIVVRCNHVFNSKVYQNVHTIIDPKQVQTKVDLKWESVPYSVLFVGIDSISKMNLIRTMSKSHQFLESNDFINLKGYTKIGDNTFPNLMAILTGKTWQQVYEHCDPLKHKMNGCDIIWERFSNLGYITAYAEDESSIGTFHYNRVGFDEAPTDFYFRPYVLAAEHLPSIQKFQMHFCSGPESSGMRILNLAKDFASTFEKQPKFALFWINTFSHDDINLVSAMDDKIEEFLKDVYQHLENTFFIFFSDHGFRFGDIRYTHSGWFEERLPFIYIHVPQTFKNKHPEEYAKLVINSKRLTTPFDLYMTLQNILLYTNAKYNVTESLACPKCHSLFKEVDESRTCKDAAISQHWCLCSGHSYINPNSNAAIESGEFIVSELNHMVEASGEGSKCAFYYLKKIAFAGMSEPYLNENNQTVNYFLVMLETRPPAMFEATIEMALEPKKFRLLGEISRTNRYGDHSQCIHGDLQKYCYCDGLFTSIKSAICNFLNCI